MHACFTSLFISLYPVPLRERKVNAVVFPLATFDAEFKSGKNEGCLHSCFCYDSVYFLCCCEKEKKIIDIKKKKRILHIGLFGAVQLVANPGICTRWLASVKRGYKKRRLPF